MAIAVRIVCSLTSLGDVKLPVSYAQPSISVENMDFFHAILLSSHVLPLSLPLSARC